MRYLVIDVLRWDVKNVHDLIYILPCPLPYIKKISSFLGKDMLFIWKTLNNDSILIPYHVLYHVPLIFIFVRKMHFSRKVRNWIVWHYWHDTLLLLDRLVLLQLVSSLISSEKSRADNLKMRRLTWTLNNDIQTSMYIVRSTWTNILWDWILWNYLILSLCKCFANNFAFVTFI